MEGSNFKIYSASAGSGKTYALAKAYLKLLLANDASIKFRQILAITFTNKAVDEMKTRILDNLYAFGQDTVPEKQESLFQSLCDELNLTEGQLRQRSQLILKRILHNYSFFEISTIDKFNHKIIKTFARDLHLSQNFEVELNLDLLLEEAVGRLLERAGNDEKLTEVLIAFSLEKIDDDKSWNITYDLIEIGKLLFQENHAEHINPLREKSIGDFQDIQKRIASESKAIEEKVKQLAQSALQEIENQGFELTDFSRGTLPNHFKKISEGFFDTKRLYANQLEENLRENKKLLNAKDNRDSSVLASTVLVQYLLIKKNLHQLAYLQNIYSNIVPMTVLNEIAKEIKNIELDRDIIPISSLNAILSKEIKNQPVPFIYERMGEKYRHYFIDEFQDTSKMQWENLVPLIGNALESENEKHERGSLFLVGDVKQAIYRWRGGRAEQFLNLINKKSHPFVVEPSVHSLDTNWRSSDEIVGFNNSFFTEVATVLANEDYRNLFLNDSHQKTNNKPGGYIQMSFLDADVEDKDEVYCEETLKAIQQILSENHAYSDICVLVRDNKKGMLLADFLAQQNIPIISSDALLLAKNEKVIFLVSLLRIFENAKDREAAYHILMYLSPDEIGKHDFISKNLENIEAFLASEYHFHINELKGEPVLTVLETAIVQFELYEGSVAHISFLMDEVLDLEKREGPSVYAFLNYWDVKKDSLSIAAPDGVDAVKIMTIHKAKGLEFPFVIFPFANAVLDDKRKKKKAWVPATTDDEALGLNEFLINSNKDMLEYNEVAQQKYVAEEQKTLLDSMNVLYVALTRPVNGLFVITESGKKEVASVEAATSYSELFQWYVQQANISEKETGVYTIGRFPSKEVGTSSESTENYISYVTRPKDDAGFTISTKSGRMWDNERMEAIEMGNVIHFALSQIETVKDVDPVLERLEIEGHFPKEAAGDIKQKIMAVVNHPKLKELFLERLQILNEQEILTTDGHSLRPDRIIIDGNDATIVDYKTGKPSPKHKEQIANYADILKAMDFKIKQSIIVYIDQEIDPIFV
ncbi:UvrD-helicase domain-containing protein [Muricauda oceani]|uniref:DNA 3'-5' helicase n=1 Tax=Flagellimonas oceani TaxID=2698672 RepID=A0A6G7J5R5_9FLAO|nr:UvrD-helicase domain-containing protein [Allomuricauda oceani]MBW8242440.1 UvrD-helicase domain-containing protein [Allomuricauda oceani]QII46203.1 UvrD-helicase domain-containing protein [Allomuricauda oceani]